MYIFIVKNNTKKVLWNHYRRKEAKNKKKREKKERGRGTEQGGM